MFAIKETYPHALGPGLSTLMKTFGCPSGPPPARTGLALACCRRACRRTTITRCNSLLYKTDGLLGNQLHCRKRSWLQVHVGLLESRASHGVLSVCHCLSIHLEVASKRANAPRVLIWAPDGCVVGRLPARDIGRRTGHTGM